MNVVSGSKLVASPPDQDDSYLDRSADAFETASCISLATSLVMAVLFVLVRRGLPSHLPQILCSVLAFFAFLGAIRFSLNRARRELPVLCLPVIGAIAVFCSVVLASWVPYLTWILLSVLSVYFLLCGGSSIRGPKWGLYVFGAIVAATSFFWASAYYEAGFWNPEQALIGSVNRDTLFQTDISAMIQRYGVVSTGVSGLRYLIYYPGSQALIAGLAKLAHVLPLWQYAEGQQIFLWPCLVFALSFCATLLLGGNKSISALTYLAVLYALSIADSPITSLGESATMGFALFFLILPAIFLYSERDLVRRLSTLVLYFLSLLVVCIALVFVKFTFMIIVCILAGCGVLYSLVSRTRYLSVASYIALPTAAALTIFAVSKVFSFQLAPFDFIGQLPRKGIFEMIVVPIGLLCFRFARWSGPKPRAVLILALGAAISFLPGALVHLPGGGASWFQFPAVLVSALPIAGAVLTGLDHAWRHAPKHRGVAWQAACCGLLAILLLLDLRLTPRPLMSLVTRADLMRTLTADTASLLAEQPNFPVATRYKWVFGAGRIFAPFKKAEAAAFDKTYMAQVYPRLSAAPADTLVFAPPSARTFWHLNSDCGSQPFLIPALTGHPMIFGVPPKELDCDVFPRERVMGGYGYEAYSEKDRSREVNDAELCKATRKAGFKSVITLREAPDYVSAPLICP